MNILDQASAGAAHYIFGDNPYMCNNGGWTVSQLQNMAIRQAQGFANYGMNGSPNRDQFGRMQDVNASTESVYPVKNGNSMNKKLEAAKKYLSQRK